MPSLKKKIIKGHIYWYAVEMARIDGKPKQVWQMYLGTAEKIIEVMKGSEDKPYARFKSFQYGKIAAMMQISEELEFIEIVNRHTDKKSIAGLTVGEYLLLDIIGKSSGILSENGLEEWFNNSALSILWKFPHKLSCQNFLNHIGYIDQATIKNIEIDISRILIEKGIKPSILYLDESNWFTYGDNYNNKSDLLKKGFNKKHRYDKNQVGVALVTNEDNIPFLHETYAGNIHDSTEFPELIDGIVNYLTDLKINTEDITLVFDKGNNSTDNKATYTLQKESYLSRKAKILEKMTDLKRRLESNRGKERDKSSVEREISDIIIKDFRSIIGYEVSDIPKGKKKPKIKFWNRKKNEEKREKSFGKLIIFTDKSEWHSKKIVQTYNNKYLVEDDFN